jgi:uncharacterized membrane protein YkoI
MKSSKIKTKAMAGLIALTLIGGMAVTAANAVAKDSLNGDVNIVVASSRNYEDGDRRSRDSKYESGERRSWNSDNDKSYETDRNKYDGKKISLEQAIKIATADTEGDVIEVEFERGRYEVKLRTKDGYKREIYISAKDGRVVKRK